MPLMAGMFLSVSDCAATQEEKDNMVGKLYRELVGALSWLALGSCPDIVFTQACLLVLITTQVALTGKQ